MTREETAIAIVGTKGQIVIPRRFRKELAIIPNTKIVVYRKDDKLVLTKLEIPPLGEIGALIKEIDQKSERKKPKK